MRSFPSVHHWQDTPGVEYKRHTEVSPAKSHDSEQQMEVSVASLQAEESQLPAVQVKVQTESYQSVCTLDGRKLRRWSLGSSQ